MRIAVCIRSAQERELLSRWIGQYCQVYGRDCSLFHAADPEELFREGRRFDVAFLGLGGPEGVLLVRRLREADKRCAIVMIDDTPENAVKGVRLHVSDYIVRPVDFKKVARAMKLALAGGGR